MNKINLIATQFNKLEKRHKTLLLLLIGVLIFSFYFSIFYKPNAAKLRRLKAELTSLDNQITKLKEQMPDIDKLRRSLNEIKTRQGNLRKEVETLESQLPTQARIPQLLGELVTQAQGLNVDFISIKPKQTKQKEYAYLEIELKISSDYPNLTNYLNRLEDLSQFLNVNQISIEQMKKESAFEANTTLLLSTLLGEPLGKEPQEGKLKVEAPSIIGTEILKIERNPFTSRLKPAKEVEKEKEYVLTGISLRGKKSTAIINNEIYRVGDVIGNKTLKQILPNMVVLSDGKQDIILLMER